MYNKNLLAIDLQLFADGAATGADGATAGAGAAQAMESKAPEAGNRRSKSGELSNVVYGKQEDAPQPNTTSSDAGSIGEENAKDSSVTTSPEGTPQGGASSGEKGPPQKPSDSGFCGERRQSAVSDLSGLPGRERYGTSADEEAKRKAFEELIEGEYKDQYTEKFNAYFNRRFKQAKTMENSLNAQKPIMDLLLQRYKITDGDLGKLQAAIEDDSQYWQEAAEEAGMTVEQYKALQKLQRENEELRRIRQREEGQQRMNQQLDQWYRQADDVKALYPSFDFKKESENRDFLGLLRSGLPVQKAYELIHMEEIKEQAARAAAQTAGQQMEARIKAKASRPTENGTSSQSAAVIKSDVSHLTRADRAEIARRVGRGENIRF